MRAGWRHACIGLLSALGLSSALAHPHIWIDSYYSVNVSTPRVQVVEAHWSFDVFSSLDMLIEFDKDANGQLEKAEKAEAAEAFTNLAQYGYFIKMQVDGQAVTPASVDVLDVGVQDQALTVRLGVTLPNEVDLQQQRLRMGFGDPENYFAMVIPEQGLVQLNGMRAETCTPMPADAAEFYMEGWGDLSCDP